jgi:hypothetical protein
MVLKDSRITVIDSTKFDIDELDNKYISVVVPDNWDTTILDIEIAKKWCREIRKTVKLNKIILQLAYTFDIGISELEELFKNYGDTCDIGNIGKYEMAVYKCNSTLEPGIDVKNSCGVFIHDNTRYAVYDLKFAIGIKHLNDDLNSGSIKSEDQIHFPEEAVDL